MSAAEATAAGVRAAALLDAHLGARSIGAALLYGFAFAIASSSTRALGIALRLLGLFLAVHIGVWLLNEKVNLLWKVVTMLAAWPGPFSPLGGRWMLIDV